MLCAYGHRFVDLEDAEEIVEDSLLWIWENRETLVIESSLSSYLFKMVYRRALNKLAHIDATQRADTRFYEEMQEMLQDTDYYQMEELTKRIEEAIAALPESYRESFVMHRFRDMSYKEMCIRDRDLFIQWLSIASNVCLNCFILSCRLSRKNCGSNCVNVNRVRA